MTEENCLNCAYLCRTDDDGTKHSLTQQQRDPVKANERSGIDERFWFGGEALCFHKQWQAKQVSDLRETVIEVIDRSILDETSRYTDVHLTNGQWLDTKTYSCGNHSPFDAESSKPLERIWEEQEQALLESKDRRRFWIITTLSTATTLGVIASAFFHWLEWNGGAP